MTALMTFRALADPNRQTIMDFLRSNGPQRTGDIAAQFADISRIAVSKHLKVLREAELVTLIDSDDNRERIYDLKPDGLETVRQWLDQYDVYWADRLQDLKRLAEAKERQKRDNTR